jgi:hypothetical protein
MGLFERIESWLQKRNGPTYPREGPKISSDGLRLGSYELCVPQGVHLNSGHVRLEHNLHYSLLMKNHGYLDCDAEVSIDGTTVGKWRIRGNTQIEIERPADDTGRFTFYMLGSGQAKKIGLSANDNLGLVTVVFMPERPPPPPPPPANYDSDDSGVRFSTARFSPHRGGTGLAGESAQKFNTVAPLDYDRSKFITIHLRLVCGDGEPRPLRRSSTTVPSHLPDS